MKKIDEFASWSISIILLAYMCIGSFTSCQHERDIETRAQCFEITKSKDCFGELKK